MPQGYNDSRDVLVSQTTDGIDYNVAWAEYQATVALHNSERQKIIQFLTFPVTQPIESVTQLSSSKFERATEYGEPRGQRQEAQSFWLGYDFDWYDLASRFTWRFLADAAGAQVDALHASAIEADNQLVFTKVLEAIYRNDNRTATIQSRPVNVYAFYNGDGAVPPKYKTNTHTGTHSHYLTSGAATITPGDLDDLYEHLRHHGFGAENGVTQLVLVNSREGKEIRKFSVLSGATYDFIPANGEPTALVIDQNQQVVGTRPAAQYAGMNVIGSYGHQLIIEDDLFPAGYVVTLGTGGTNNLSNPIGFREHENASLRGMRLVKGRDASYPLIDSFYNRGFGTGIRQRGGGAVMQITANPAYAAPAEYAGGTY